MKKILIIMFLIFLSGCSNSHDENYTAEKLAVATESHPLAGFWKQADCKDGFGIAIAPATGNLYSLSFCGPGGCFKPGTYRPNTRIKEDPDYKLVNKNTIKIMGRDGFTTYVRCPSRKST